MTGRRTIGYASDRVHATPSFRSCALFYYLVCLLNAVPIFAQPLSPADSTGLRAAKLAVTSIKMCYLATSDMPDLWANYALGLGPSCPGISYRYHDCLKSNGLPFVLIYDSEHGQLRGFAFAESDTAKYLTTGRGGNLEGKWRTPGIAIASTREDFTSVIQSPFTEMYVSDGWLQYCGKSLASPVTFAQKRGPGFIVITPTCLTPADREWYATTDHGFAIYHNAVHVLVPIAPGFMFYFSRYNHPKVRMIDIGVWIKHS